MLILAGPDRSDFNQKHYTFQSCSCPEMVNELRWAAKENAVSSHWQLNFPMLLVLFFVSLCLFLFLVPRTIFLTLTINSFQEPRRNISKSGPVGAPHRPFTSWDVSFDHEVGRVHPQGKDGSVSSISFRIWPKESGNSLEEWGSGTMNLPASCCFRLDFASPSG